MVATQCIQTGGSDEGDLLKSEASDFELVTIAGVFHKLLIYWDFTAHASPGSQRMIQKE